ncbi:AAA family ATPase [Oscillibacter sp. MSJ-2]|uniref:AAA family ATPase n=1 Tax=Dysosmobacter acutus TaxID=2841504 RepID=A0ABS6F8R0_9FIRM|nr:AAA family ATPase [Dysosmobacter acutus]MBU5626674.1 AAA family ATPase [Dysosmobacter acutus]
MNIKEAKQEISNTLRAYLTRDELGGYLIPAIRQRPILLMGPPGIGKTQIMEQIAAETDVGLVSYTITHHTRQSAMGLPFIRQRTYGGQERSVTEYTMSEILASVHELMERTGIREGILFLDEINCVSETLAPMMLQFLQCKTFGNQPLPEGWMIVAAGNPPEYNKSVRDFDVVTLDRVKRIDVTEDFGVWKEYAHRRGLHGAVISYLDIKKENFYQVETSVDGLQFATARGWEDLSELMQVYERLGIPVTREVIGQYIQLPRIAKDFAGYLALYYKYQRTYHVEEILRGTYPASTASELRSAPFDERLSVMGLMMSRLSEAARKVRMQDQLTQSLHGDLLQFRERIGAEAPDAVLRDLTHRLQAEGKRRREAGQENRELRALTARRIQALDSCRQALAGENSSPMDAVRPLLQTEVDERKALAEEASGFFDHAFSFLEDAFGPSQELVIFVTEITAGYDTSWFVETFGCDAYFRHNKELMFDSTRRRIHLEIEAARSAEQAP